MVEVKIPSEHMVNKNLAVKATQLWGTDVYTDESDVVAVLMHTGFFNSAVSEPTWAAARGRSWGSSPMSTSQPWTSPSGRCRSVMRTGRSDDLHRPGA